MRIKSNPKRNIRLIQLKDCQKGFISLFDVRAISGEEKFNFVINLQALVYTVKSDNICIPVFGTGDGNLDFEIDLSSFIVDKPIKFSDLKLESDQIWEKLKINIIDNVLSYDSSDFDEDELFDDFFDDWFLCADFEKEDLIKEVKDFLLRDCDSLDVNEIIVDRKNLIKKIRSLEKLNHSDQNYYHESDSDDDLGYKYDDFSIYSFEERTNLLDLFNIKLEFINVYLLSGDRWQELPKSVFLAIRDYMVKIENYEILSKPSKYFAK